MDYDNSQSTAISMITSRNDDRSALRIPPLFLAKVSIKWYNFVTSITEYTSIETETIVRNQAKEAQALQDTIYVIGGKWKLPIINSICNGNKRFREIERSIPGITTRMLSRELKELEMNKLITRTVYPDTPVLVEYESTDYCKTFGPIILAMIEWGIAHRQKVAEQ